MSEHIPMLLTDFNARDLEGNVLALVPMIGERVLVRDAEGNRAQGEVVRRADGLLHVSIAWDTWEEH